MTSSLHGDAGSDGGELRVFSGVHDGFAFLDQIGWDHIERKQVSGDAEFGFDLCSLPVPEG